MWDDMARAMGRQDPVREELTTLLSKLAEDYSANVVGLKNVNNSEYLKLRCLEPFSQKSLQAGGLYPPLGFSSLMVLTTIFYVLFWPKNIFFVEHGRKTTVKFNLSLRNYRTYRLFWWVTSTELFRNHSCLTLLTRIWAVDMQFFLVTSTEPLKFVLVGCSRFHGNANLVT